MDPLTYLFIVKNELETRAKELTAEESQIADQRDRLEAERAIDFFDELGSDVVSARLFVFWLLQRQGSHTHSFSSSSRRMLPP